MYVRSAAGKLRSQKGAATSNGVRRPELPGQRVHRRVKGILRRQCVPPVQHLRVEGLQRQQRFRGDLLHFRVRDGMPETR